jgi:glucose/arabinose dehydrogenase
MRFLAVALAFTGLALVFLGCAQGPSGKERVQVVAENLEVPWSIGFLPDGDIVFTERPGRIRIIHDGVLLAGPAATINVATVGESGLLGIAVDPQFESNRFIYVYYTYFRTENNLSKMYNRVSRFVLADNRVSDEAIIIDGIPGGKGDQGFHNGGRIRFGPDGKLYITTGDGGVTENAQNLNSMGGKILRINKDGSIPSDNPFPGSAVFSYGHRNPQGIAWRESGGPGTGNWELYATEHGPVGNDELNLIEPGKNYLWPDKQCTASNDPAVFCFTETIAPSGADFDGNDLYIAALRGTHVRKVTIGDNGTVVSQQVFLLGYGRIRDAVVKDGHLYVLTSNRDGRALVSGSIPGAGDDYILKVRLNE